MVDKYDDRDSVQSEEGIADEGREYGEQGETWQEGQAPVDDFGDEQAATAETTDDAVEEESDSGVEEQPSKRGSMMLPVVAGVIGLLFVGTMIYVQYGGNSSGSNGPSMAEVLAKNEGAMAPQLPETAATTNSSYSSENSAFPSSQTNGAASSGTAVATTTSVMDKTISSEPMTTVAASPVAMPVPPVAAPVAPVQAPSPLVPPATAATSVDVKIAGLTDQLNELQKSLSQLTLQLSQLSSTVANLQAASPQAVPMAPSPEVAERLMKLEQQISALAAKAVSVQAPVQKAASADITPAEMLVAPSATEEPASVAKQEKTLKSAKSVKPSKKTAAVTTKRSTKKEKASSSKGWVLRAATPDTAWVSKTVDSDELRQVEIGQNLPGIGKVRSIRQTAQGWEIVGSSGTLH